MPPTTITRANVLRAAEKVHAEKALSRKTQTVSVNGQNFVFFSSEVLGEALKNASRKVFSGR